MAAGDIRAGRAVVELVSDNNPLSRGLKLADAELKAWGKSISSVGQGIASFGALSMAGDLAKIAFAFGAANKFADSASEIGHMSERTGIATQKLALLKFAASQTGTSLEEMETAIKRMQKTIVAGDPIFAQLGLSISALKNMSPDQAFETIASALAKVENPTKKAADAMKIFGRSGTSILPMLKDGAEGLEALMQKGEAAGLAMGVDSAKNAIAFKQALGLLHAQLDKIVTTIGGAVAPIFTELLARTTPVLKTIIEFVKENAGLAATLLQGAAAGVAFGAVVVGLGMAIGAMGAVVGGLGAVLGLMATAIGAAFSIATGAVAVFGAAYGILTMEIGTVSGIMAGASAIVGAVWSAACGVGATSTMGLGTAMGIASVMAGLLASATSAAGAVIGFVTAPVFLLGAAFTAVGLIALHTFATASDEGRRSATALTQAWSDIKSSALDAWGGITSALKSGDLVSAGKIAMDGLRIIWEAIVAALKSVWSDFITFITVRMLDGLIEIHKSLGNLIPPLKNAIVTLEGFKDTVTKMNEEDHKRFQQPVEDAKKQLQVDIEEQKKRAADAAKKVSDGGKTSLGAGGLGIMAAGTTGSFNPFALEAMSLGTVQDRQLGELIAIRRAVEEQSKPTYT